MKNIFIKNFKITKEMAKKQTQAQAQTQQAVAEPKGWKLFTNGRGVRTGEVKLSFPRLFELDPTAEFNKDKYSTSIVITEEEKEFLEKVVVKNTYYDAIKTYQKWGGAQPKNFQMPTFKLLSLEEKEMFYPASQGTYYSLIAKTNEKPQLVDLQTKPLQDKNELYSGVIVRLSLSAYPWAYGGKTGVSFSLGVVQKLADGQRIGGSPANDLSMFADTSDVEFSSFGGDPFAEGDPFAQPQQPQQAQQSVASGSNDGDLLMPMPNQPQVSTQGSEVRTQAQPAPHTSTGDALPF